MEVLSVPSLYSSLPVVGVISSSTTFPPLRTDNFAFWSIASSLRRPVRSSELERLEYTVVREANSLGIGPMGLGGSTTLLGARIGLAGRHPACFFVTVSYSCWATRRMTVELDARGRIAQWQ